MLLLETIDNLLLLVLVGFELGMLLLAFIEQVVLLPLDMLQLLVLVRHLHLLGLYRLTLRFLIVGILAHETQAAVHLIKVLR